MRTDLVDPNPWSSAYRNHARENPARRSTISNGAHACRESESISRLEFTAVDCGLLFFRISPDSTGGPAQIEGGTQREYHGRAVDLGLKADALLSWRQGKVQRSAKDHRVQLPDIGVDCCVIDLSLHQECSSIRPVQRRNADDTSAMNKSARVDPRERARPGNAGGSYVAERIVGSGIQRLGSGGSLPLSIW